MATLTRHIWVVLKEGMHERKKHAHLARSHAALEYIYAFVPRIFLFMLLYKLADFRNVAELITCLLLW